MLEAGELCPVVVAGDLCPMEVEEEEEWPTEIVQKFLILQVKN